MARSWVVGFGLQVLDARARSRSTLAVVRVSRSQRASMRSRAAAATMLAGATGPGTAAERSRGRRRPGRGADVGRRRRRRPRSAERSAAPTARPVRRRRVAGRGARRASASRPARTASSGSDLAPLRRAGRFGRSSSITTSPRSTEVPGQSGAVAAGAFDRPRPQPAECRSPSRPARRSRRGRCRPSISRPRAGRRGTTAAVWVCLWVSTPMTTSTMFCQHGHAFTPCQDGTCRSGPGRRSAGL